MENECQYSLNQLNNSGDGSSRKCILKDPGNYALYIQRKKWLLSLKENDEINTGEYIRPEINYTKELIREHFKNYQIWNHLRFLNQEFGVELFDNEFFMEIFQRDTRNCYLFDYLNWYVVNTQDVKKIKELVVTMCASESNNNSVLVLKNTLDSKN